ncbi:MAG: GTP cyclohydrolase II [Zymomonas mobilis subsp. pomaceae]|uniref:GTP cyclohydrolase-2 n=1 Tax=Zymomonas mobilis subsp. pomaceae (strain ATCC 29192 / DSM 22645 / JCM 10191 / CCUG 17912 / NBRC 13757 / NCIMB 11200 / NRRL B-4491 / Barker I) TaxID=579138 RepID=F8EV92_ZYMMT|nr:GTP cyclohydrolase II [Zymomonas mobilis]AEI38310.1 GTP cyclohydrolase II [Zymomonas mobilis subsp. pomaceae ATCC 29192]MDX5947999.1 GTP cyclohydrolase II [Zymomonas mobilis subsp. pomaceae]GEB89329.1 GTP cyclohydrolase-2 [Zymomonas mobilis subsp. pomaceae]
MVDDRKAVAVAQAIDALRRGWPVTISDENEALSLLAVERADDYRLASFDPDKKANILLSAARAETLKLANEKEAATPNQAVTLIRTPWIDCAGALALADPSMDMEKPLKGPFKLRPTPVKKAAMAALELARLAGILPAFFMQEGVSAQTLINIPAIDINNFSSGEGIYIAARARLPIALGDHGPAIENSQIVAFRSAADAVEHVAIVIGHANDQPPIIRLHSECLTGDVFGSLKCDCGPQLHQALRIIAESGYGILLYLRQEGRGIGLINKLRAYVLQDQGFDTVDANLRLGFANDARDFRLAARMLSELNVGRVRLLTNNPDKVSGLKQAGIDVLERIPLKITPNAHNQAYLETKRDRSGHQL